MKNLAVLLLLLVLLLGGYFLVRSFPRTNEFAPPPEFHVEKWQQADFNKVLMVFEDDSKIELAKQNGVWMVNGFMADQDRLQDLVAAFGQADITSRVSTNAQNHDRFEVGSSGVQLTIEKNDQSLQQFIVGKSAGGESVYVRLSEEDEVYVLTGLPRYLVSDELDIWRERDIVLLEPDQIRAVRFQQGLAGWDLFLEDAEWKLQTGQGAQQNVDEQKALAHLAKIRNLSAVEFAENEEPGQELYTFTVEQGTEDELSQTYTYRVLASEQADRLFVSDEEGLLYLLQESALEQVFVPYLELLEELQPEQEADSE
jgi:hypothetical protein